MNEKKTTYYVSAIPDWYGLSGDDPVRELAENIAGRLGKIFPQVEFVVTTDQVLLQNRIVIGDMEDGTVDEGLLDEIELTDVLEDAWIETGL